MDLATASSVLRLLADPTRVRLLALLESEELTVAELAAVLQLAQPRVSTHLAKLKEADLVRDRRAGVSAYYRANSEGDEHQHLLLKSLRESIDDALLREDAARVPGVLGQPRPRGRLGRHRRRRHGAPLLARAAPGKPWPAHCCSCWRPATCWTSPPATASPPSCWRRTPARSSASTPASAWSRPPRKRLAPFANVDVRQGDMQALDLGERRFDLVLMLHALTYAEQPARAVAEAARLLRPGGRLLAVTLGQHDHRAAVEPFDHRNLGFSRQQLDGFARDAGLEVLSANRLSRERKAPHFEVISLLARKP